MITTKNNSIQAYTEKRIEVERTHEYVPIIGNIIGYWRQVKAEQIGEEIILNLNTPLSEYDRLIINGQEIPIPKELLTNRP